MADNIRTFGRMQTAPLTFAQALKFHPMILPVTQEFMAAKDPNTKLAVDCVVLRDLWDGLCGTADLDDDTTCIAQCVQMTIPMEHVTVIRRASGVTAAFAYCEIAKQLKSVRKLRDDFEVREAMVRAWKEFEQRRQEANQVQEGFGCDDSQSWLTLRDIGKEPDSETFKAKMLAIALLAGRMMEHFGYQKKEHPNRDPEEVSGATVGAEIDRILPTELALLADDDMQDAQAMKILQGRAPILEMEGKESKSRGPLVLAVDESGSMHDGDNSWGGRASGTAAFSGRNTWAKACCVALTRIAWSENRPVVCVHFGNGTEVQDIPKDDTRALFEMARSFLSGGTSFGAALGRSQVSVGDLEANGFKGADIVLITDGEDGDHAAHTREIDRMDQRGIKLWTVAIGQDIGANNPVRQRAERYTFAHDRDLKSHKTAVHLAEGLDKAAMGNDPMEVN